MTHPQLYLWQQEALSAWVFHGRRGIIEAVTGAGKTNLALAAIQDHLTTVGSSVAVIVPTADLLYQWQRAVAAWFGWDLSRIGLSGDGHRDRVGRQAVTVYVAMSAAERLPIETTVASSAGPVLLVADECHRYGATGFSRALRAPFASTLGLSATPERQDDGIEEHVIPNIGSVVCRCASC